MTIKPIMKRIAEIENRSALDTSRIEELETALVELAYLVSDSEEEIAEAEEVVESEVEA